MRMIDCRTGGERNVDLADDLAQGDVFYDEYGRVRSVDECEAEWRTRGVVPEMVRHIGAWMDES